jgi:hypothetical protein
MESMLFNTSKVSDRTCKLSYNWDCVDFVARLRGTPSLFSFIEHRAWGLLFLANVCLFVFWPVPRFAGNCEVVALAGMAMEFCGLFTWYGELGSWCGRLGSWHQRVKNNYTCISPTIIFTILIERWYLMIQMLISQKFNLILK